MWVVIERKRQPEVLLGPGPPRPLPARRRSRDPGAGVPAGRYFQSHSVSGSSLTQRAAPSDPARLSVHTHN